MVLLVPVDHVLELPNAGLGLFSVNFPLLHLSGEVFGIVAHYLHQESDELGGVQKVLVLVLGGPEEAGVEAHCDVRYGHFIVLLFLGDPIDEES